MKTTFLMLLLIVSASCFSQSKKRPGMPDVGYWVVESNVSTPRESTIYFYTNDQVLVHTEKVSGRKVNIKRKRIVESLNAALYESLSAWSRGVAIKKGSLLVKLRS